MPIIDKSYFETGKLFIPNTQAVPDIKANTATNEDKLTAAIAKYERLLLVNALGVVQYNDLITNPTAQKWVNLVNGMDYGDKRFDGIKQIIAYYVYVNFLKYDVVQYNTTGLERTDAANSTSINHNERLVDYWNTFVNMYQYHNSCGIIFYGEYNSTFTSLWEFLSSNSEDYSVNFFNLYQIQNVLGL